ncbi:type II toxin-antitoxin system RelE/ParE family toxin [Endozoicomonas sp. ALC020]|uniref:type II toxin-antitoxin system RelE/ParE family toxin n=1 Tax=unclassified Endozoicomonas TaxID=2644528 RepID=UPI003BAFC25E
MEIKWLRKALESLNNELDYISHDDPAAAQKILERIHKAVLSLADNPSAGRAGRVSGTRELVVPNTRYVVPYRVRLDLERVEILRVFHCSRRPPKNW